MSNVNIMSVPVKREGKDEIVHLDAARDTFAADLTEVVRLKQAEAEAPLNERIAALEADNTALRSALVGEVVRLKRIEGEADVKAETDYLSGLPVARLQMEFERANKSAAPKAALTTPDSPEAANADWGVVTTA